MVAIVPASRVPPPPLPPLAITTSTAATPASSTPPIASASPRLERVFCDAGSTFDSPTTGDGVAWVAANDVGLDLFTPGVIGPLGGGGVPGAGVPAAVA